MKNRKYMMIAIIALAIGFASISTVLYINGVTSISTNEEDFIKGIIFDEDSTVIKPNEASVELSESKRTINATSQDFKSLGDEIEITYAIKNNSQYDAVITGVSCYFVNDFTNDNRAENVSNVNDYVLLSPAQNLVGKVIKTKTISETSTVKAKMVKSYVSESENNKMNVKFQCVFDVVNKEEFAINNPLPDDDEDDDDNDDNKKVSIYDMMKSKANPSQSINFLRDADEGNSTGIFMTTKTDSGEPSYYYRGKVNNYIIFANKCWNIVRTTETKGVKLMYYSPVNKNGGCSVEYTDGYSTDYARSSYFSGEFYYSKTYEFDADANLYKLTGDIIKAPLSAAVEGYYTFKSTNIDTSTNNIYEVVEYESEKYAKTLERRGQDSSIPKEDVYSNYKLGSADFGVIGYMYGVAPFIGVKASSSSRPIAYAGTDVKIAKSTKFDTKTGYFYLVEDLKTVDLTSTNIDDVKDYYTCFSSNDYCDNYYMKITDITSSEIKYDNYNMSSNYGTSYQESHSNVYDSDIKKYNDKWYEDNLRDYENYIEDTVYCNNRNLVTGADPSAVGFGDKSVYFKSYETLTSGTMNPSLVCKNTTGLVPENNDSFTVSESIGNGKLKYPIATITADELVFAGFSFNSYGMPSSLSRGNGYITMTPYQRANNYIHSSGNSRLSTYTITSSSKVYPVISLKNNVKIKSGDGTEKNPFKVEMDGE